MSDTVFTQVTYSVDSIINDIKMGVVGLPDIQRPFVWKNASVRDLFDSMYRGYPVGYLLFWRNGAMDDSSSIGVDQKQKTPSLLIVDGQQRLTSLYTVIKGIEVVRQNYSKERIKIAFDPLQEKFAVADGVISRDASYIPDISFIWRSDCDLFSLVDEYLNGLKRTMR